MKSGDWGGPITVLFIVFHENGQLVFMISIIKSRQKYRINFFHAEPFRLLGGGGVEIVAAHCT
jgi:uncharacterized membrane protein YecN with MAPEG domain